MTVFNNRRQENICCYNNLEWQLMIEWEWGVIGGVRREKGGYGVVWRRALGDLEDHRSTLHGVDQFARCGPTRVAASQEGFAGKIGPPHILRFGRRTVLPERNE